MNLAFINVKIITEDGIIWNGYVKTNGTIISEMGVWNDGVTLDEYQVVDGGGKYLAPGLIDIHNHGSENFNFNENPLYCAERVIKHGVTTVLPTFYTSMTLEDMIEGCNRVKKACKTGIGKIMDGLYMEGPYMNGTGCFASQMKQWEGKLNPKVYSALVGAVGDFARVWAIDPAREGIDDFMAYVKSEFPSAIFAYGHSHATSGQCRRVKHFGVRDQTHHGDSGKAKGMAQGTIGAGCDEFTLYDPDIYAELICDEVGIHVNPDMIKMVVRTKGVEKIILISDSFCCKQNYKNNEAAGIAYGPDLNYDDEGMLAGSHLTLDKACLNMMTHTGYGLCHAIRFASINPARMLGIDDRVGSIALGKTANLILIDDMIRVDSVYLEGELAVNNGQIMLSM